MSSANLLAETQLKFSNERVLSTGEPYTYKYATLIEPFHKQAIFFALKKR